jgi:hypothetical protein
MNANVCQPKFAEIRLDYIMPFQFIFSYNGPSRPSLKNLKQPTGLCQPGTVTATVHPTKPQIHGGTTVTTGTGIPVTIPPTAKTSWPAH